MIGVHIKRRNLKKGWGLGEQCGHQGTGQDVLSVNQGRTAQTARNALKMKRDGAYLPLDRAHHGHCCPIFWTPEH